MPGSRHWAPSKADFVAFERAWHLLYRSPVMRDPYPRLPCGPALGLALRYCSLGWLVTRYWLGLIVPASMSVVVRARYVEQALEEAIREGVAQCVIVSAGMDSFAWRRADPLGRAAVFEIDRPREQERKLGRIRSGRSGRRPGGRCDGRLGVGRFAARPRLDAGRGPLPDAR